MKGPLSSSHLRYSLVGNHPDTRGWELASRMSILFGASTEAVMYPPYQYIKPNPIAGHILMSVNTGGDGVDWPLEPTLLSGRLRTDTLRHVRTNHLIFYHIHHHTSFHFSYMLLQQLFTTFCSSENAVPKPSPLDHGHGRATTNQGYSINHCLGSHHPNPGESLGDGCHSDGLRDKAMPLTCGTGSGAYLEDICLN